ncbi:hypothetical protein R1U54_000105 [Vibrio fluvialis]|nr:hypothetical protein [Vibrio fluvialis]
METFSFLKEVIEVFELPKFLLAVTATLLWASKHLVTHFQSKSKRKVEALSQIIEYFKENPRHDFFIVEQLFLKYFEVRIPYRGIKLFLNSPFPSEYFFEYRNGWRYLEFDENYRYVRYIKGKSSLRVDEVKAWIQYVVFGGAGILMFFHTKSVLNNANSNLIVWLGVAFYLALLGGMSLSKIISIQSATDLVELQKKCSSQGK